MSTVKPVATHAFKVGDYVDVDDGGHGRIAELKDSDGEYFVELDEGRCCYRRADEMRPAKPVAPTPPTRFADADLSTWCQRYEGEPDEGVVCGVVDGVECIAQVGFNPACASADQRCRRAVADGRGGFTLWDSGLCRREFVTREQAIRWVRDGVLP